MRSGEEDIVCRLIEESFNEFVAPEYTEAGVKEFFKYANPQSLKERAKKDHFVIVALDGDKVVGVIEILYDVVKCPVFSFQSFSASSLMLMMLKPLPATVN